MTVGIARLAAVAGGGTGCTLAAAPETPLLSGQAGMSTRSCACRSSFGNTVRKYGMSVPGMGALLSSW